MRVYIEVEHRAVHRAVDDPVSIQPVVAQGTDERLGAPVTERGMTCQALPARSPAGGFDHVGLDRGLVDEGQSFQMPSHEGLTLCDLDMAQVGDVFARLLKRLKDFFLCDRPSRCSSRPTDERCTFRP